MALLPTWLPLPSTTQMVELIAGASILLGLYFVISKVRKSDSDLKWLDLLVAVGAFAVPTLVILGVEGFFHPVAASLVIGLLLGHTLAMLDWD